MNIVEHVGRAIADAHMEDYREYRHLHDALSRAAIIATLQYARDNPTDRMLTAMRLANMNVAGGYGGPSGWEAAIDALLQEIGGGE